MSGVIWSLIVKRVVLRFLGLLAVGWWLGWSGNEVWAEHDEIASAFDVAMQEDLPGKYVKGDCLPFARVLYSRLTRAGIEAHLLVYSWRDDSGELGVHAFVVYRDEEGRYWGMDNERFRPLWLTGGTPGAWCQYFSPASVVAVQSQICNRTPVRNPLRTVSRSVVAAAAAPVAQMREPAAVPGAETILAMSALSSGRRDYFSDRP